MTTLIPETLIDTLRYPIFDAGSDRYVNFVEECRKTYADTGALALEAFLTADGLDQLCAEAAAVAHLSFSQTKIHNAYLDADDPAFPADHPRNRPLTTTTSTVADADIPQDAGLRALYACTALHKFIAAVVGKPAIHPYEDTLSPLNIGVTGPAQLLDWHFDKSDFATTLLLQAAETGGAFEYVPLIRNDSDDAYPEVEKLLDGDRGSVKTLSMRPGTLALFRGRRSIHRVAPVAGERLRLIAILSYDEKPGQRMNAFTQEKFYGRAA